MTKKETVQFILSIVTSVIIAFWWLVFGLMAIDGNDTGVAGADSVSRPVMGGFFLLVMALVLANPFLYRILRKEWLFRVIFYGGILALPIGAFYASYS